MVQDQSIFNCFLNDDFNKDQYLYVPNLKLNHYLNYHLSLLSGFLSLSIKNILIIDEIYKLNGTKI